MRQLLLLANLESRSWSKSWNACARRAPTSFVCLARRRPVCASSCSASSRRIATWSRRPNSESPPCRTKSNVSTPRFNSTAIYTAIVLHERFVWLLRRAQNAQLRQAQPAAASGTAAASSADSTPAPAPAPAAATMELEARIRQLEANLLIKDRIRSELDQKNAALLAEIQSIKSSVSLSLSLCASVAVPKIWNSFLLRIYSYCRLYYTVLVIVFFEWITRFTSILS